MLKILELDSAKLYSQNRVHAWCHSSWSKKRRINPEWAKIALNSSQQKFLENRRAVFRPHPRHNPTIELFIDESTLDSRDWTMLYLLF